MLFISREPNIAR